MQRAVKNELRADCWPVYERYDVRHEGDEAFVVAEPPVWEPGRALDEDLRRAYYPLRTPELLLDFRELAEKEDIGPEDVRRWARWYGLLGIPGIDTLVYEWGSSQGAARRESVARFAREARSLNRCLRLWETAVRDGGPDRAGVESAVAHDPALSYWLSKRADSEVEEWARDEVLKTVQRRLREETFQQLYRYRTGKLVGGIGSKNLLGAIWLQMSWLLMDDTHTKRCKAPDCRRVIYFEPGMPPPADAPRGARGKPKTRKDREYCRNRPCKQRHHAQQKAERRRRNS